MEQDILVLLATLVKLHYKTCSHRVCFVFLVVHWGLNEIRTVISSENSQLLQSYTVTYGKKLEKVIFVKEESLRKKINNKDVYVVYGAKGDIPEKAVEQ